MNLGAARAYTHWFRALFIPKFSLFLPLFYIFMPQNGSFLAFDTSTDVMSIALTNGVQTWAHTGPGGAKASTTLIPAILALLAVANMALGDLQAIAFGRGPGSLPGCAPLVRWRRGLRLGQTKGQAFRCCPSTR